MHTSAHGSARSAAETVLLLAKKLHRAAASESLALSLPVLRRLLATHTRFEIFLCRSFVASARWFSASTFCACSPLEVGFSSWEAYRQALKQAKPDELAHFDSLQTEAGYPNIWFSTAAKASSHAQQHGGKVVVVGHQAVVVREEMLSEQGESHQKR